MVEGALNAAAELVLEATAYGNLARARRQPQPARRAAGPVPRPRAGAVAGGVGRDRRPVAGPRRRPRRRRRGRRDPTSPVKRGGAPGTTSSTTAGRVVRRHARSADAAELLRRARRARGGRPRPAVDVDHPQLQARRFYEAIDHPVVGRLATPTLPFRFASVDRWLRTPGADPRPAQPRDPRRRLGVDEATYAALEAKEVIGTRPKGL